MSKFYPAPFPKDVAAITLAKVSLAKLLEKDEDQMNRLFEICKSPGFFYLDMTDHPIGTKMLDDAHTACEVGMKLFPNMTVEEKKTYKTRDRIGVFDRGYFTKDVLPDGEPRYSETLNIPQTELFARQPTNFQLPSWLAPHIDTFRSVLESGNAIANVIFEVLEQCLQLPTGSITSLHRLTDPSSDFLRMLRYTGVKAGKTVDQLTFPAHKDAISLAILFTWLGGLQIPAPDAVWLGPEVVTEESWRWVEPLPGYAIINIGDAMEILTNKVLKSGLHRVVRAPGAQAPFDKYSVLVAARPADTTPMVPFKSPLIPELTAEQAALPVLTSEEWGTSKILGLQALLKKRDEDGEVLKLV